MNKAIEALFGNFPDAYTVLEKGTTVLDENDTALVLTDENNLQLFLPGNGKVSDRGLALVEIYNAMCRDKAGMIDKDGRAISENQPYQGFTTPFTQIMKSMVTEPDPVET